MCLRTLSSSVRQKTPAPLHRALLSSCLLCPSGFPANPQGDLICALMYYIQWTMAYSTAIAGLSLQYNKQMETDWLIPSRKVWVFVDGLYRPATVTRNDKGKEVECKLEDTNQSVKVSHKVCYHRGSADKNFCDMCAMEILNEPEIFHNLVRRYQNKDIYTAIGSILIAINPYTQIEELYSKERLQSIRQKVLSEENIDTLNPHVYILAGRAFRKLGATGRKQAIVISGQSGAGKTENTKYCMRFITSLSHHHSWVNPQTKSIEDIVLQCNPILQAFGNCKTVRNNNSSRFGKFVRLFIDKNVQISGAKIQNYLLQKSRVTSVAKNQRTFHVFYSLLKSKQKQELGLRPDQRYEYLEKSGCMDAEGINDTQNYEIIKTSLADMGLGQQSIRKIFISLAGILLLGNLRFDDRQNAINSNVNCSYCDLQLVKRVCKNLLVKREEIDGLLLEQKRLVGKQVMLKRLDKNQVVTNRNTLAKALYNRIFEYLVERINDKLQINRADDCSISILDIFGFEIFDHNSLEQLCINYANQRLQKLFTKYIFQNELEELKRDGLEAKIRHLVYPDNRQIIELIQKRMGISVFSMIDQKTTLGSAKDEDVVLELRKIKNKHIHVDPEPNRTKFIILHTQSPVIYDIAGFRFKNQDSITPEIEHLIDRLFPLKESQENKGKTLVTRFDKHLRVLNEELQKSQLHFIRCIKPNQQKAAYKIDQRYVLEQMKYMGVLETIQIRKNTFPCRISYRRFIDTFKMMVGIEDKVFGKLSLVEQSVTILKRLLPGIQKEKGGYELGNERIYLRQEHEKRLNSMLFKEHEKRARACEVIVRNYKKCKYRRVLIKGLKCFLRRSKLLFQILEKLHTKIRKLELQRYHKRARAASQHIKRLNERKKIQSRRKQNQMIVMKFAQLSPVIVRYQKYLFFQKLRHFTQQHCMYSTAINYSTVTPPTVVQQKPKNDKNPPAQQIKVSLLNYASTYQTVLVHPPQSQHNVAFRGEVQIQGYDSSKCNMKKLFHLINHCPIRVNEEQMEPQLSIDNYYDIKRDLDKEIMNDLHNFIYIDFYEQHLRKKKTMFGRYKSAMERLSCKPQQMGRSLLPLPEDDEKKALLIFSKLLHIADEHKAYQIYNSIEEIISILCGGTQMLKDEAFVQFLKQQTTHYEYPSIKMYQTMTILLHVHRISDDHLMAGMSWLLERYQNPSVSYKTKEYINYVFPKLLRQYLMKDYEPLRYIPPRYHMMALMTKRQLSLLVFFSIGQQVLINVEYFQTFSDIKQRACIAAGLNYKRFRGEILVFVEIVNFENAQMQQNPIDDRRIVWDVLTEWEVTKSKIIQEGARPPIFILMMKFRHVFELHPNDAQGIELIYAQCYFDLFLGRIKLPYELLLQNSAIMKIIDPNTDIQNLIPVWVVSNDKQKQDYIRAVQEVAKSLKGRNRTEFHFRFIKNCQSHSLCMASCYSTQTSLKIFVKLKKIFLVENDSIVEELGIRKILRWGTEGNTFILMVHDKNGEKSINIRMREDHAKILSNNLENNMKLILSFQKSK